MLNIVNRSCHIILRMVLIDSQIMGISGFLCDNKTQKLIQSKVLRIFTFFTNVSFLVVFILLFHRIKESDWQSVGSTAFILVTFVSFVLMMVLSLTALWRIMITQRNLISTVNSIISILKVLSARKGVNIFDTEFFSFLLLKLLVDLFQAVLQLHVMISTITNSGTQGFMFWIIFSYNEHAGYSILNVSFVFMLSIGHCFKLCAEEIHRILQKLDSIKDYQRAARVELLCRASDEIDEIMSLWNSTNNVYVKAQTTFSYQNLAIVVCSYWDSVLQLYHSFVAKVDTSSQREEHPFFLELLFGLCAFCQLTLFVLAASSSFRLSQRVRGYLEQILNLSDVDDRLTRNVKQKSFLELIP